MRKIVVFCSLLPAVLFLAGCSALEPDYPLGEPAKLTQRLTDRAQWAYDAMELPPHKAVRPRYVTPEHSCLAGGFTVDEMAPDVVTYALSRGRPGRRRPRHGSAAAPPVHLGRLEPHP
jgi:hypothetical protein